MKDERIYGDWKSVQLLFPFATLVLLAVILPLIVAIRTGFQADEATGEIGFLFLFRDPLFRGALARTISFASVLTIIQIALALAVACCVYRRTSISVLIGLLSIPAAISPPVVALVWRVMLDPANGMFSAFVVQNRWADWTNSSYLALLVVAIVDTWQWLPMLVLLSVLLMVRVDSRLIEMAMLDGGRRINVLFRIVVRPTLPTVTLMAAFRFADLTRFFDIPFVMTRGGPGSATEFVGIYAYRYSMEFFRAEVGAAAGIVLLSSSILAGVIARPWIQNTMLGAGDES